MFQNFENFTVWGKPLIFIAVWTTFRLQGLRCATWKDWAKWKLDVWTLYEDFRFCLHARQLGKRSEGIFTSAKKLDLPSSICQGPNPGHSVVFNHFLMKVHLWEFQIIILLYLKNNILYVSEKNICTLVWISNLKFKYWMDFTWKLWEVSH